MHHFGSINFLAVLVAALSGFVVGALWYGPLFSKAWMVASGMTKEKGAKSNPAVLFGTAFVLNLIAATGLASLISGHGGWHFGLHEGLAAGLFFVATAIGVIFLFEMRPLKLFLIDAGYMLVNFGVMGTILGAWPN